MPPNEEPTEPQSPPPEPAVPPATGRREAAPSAPAEQPKPQAGRARQEREMNDKQKNRRFSQETVLSRARRMFRSEMKKVSQALGMESYEPGAFNKRIEDLLKQRQEGMSSDERSERRIKELEEKVVDLSSKLSAASSEAQKLKREHGMTQKEMEKLKTEYEIKDLASKTGLVDLDYGLHLLRQHIRGLPAGEAVDDSKIKSFFEGLKKDPSKRVLFAEEKVPAGPRSLADDQQAKVETQQSAIPPQGAPKPSDAQPAPEGDMNVEKMEKQKFNDYARQKYGFSPGMA